MASCWACRSFSDTWRSPLARIILQISFWSPFTWDYHHDRQLISQSTSSKHLSRSAFLATSPLLTFTKIWSDCNTSSMSFSIPSLEWNKDSQTKLNVLALLPPRHHLVLVAGQLKSLAALLHLNNSDVGQDLLVGWSFDSAPWAHLVRSLKLLWNWNNPQPHNPQS